MREVHWANQEICMLRNIVARLKKRFFVTKLTCCKSFINFKEIFQKKSTFASLA